MSWQKTPATLEALFEEVAPQHPVVERRQNLGYPCAVVRGNIFCGLYADRMMLRLPAALRERFVRMEGGIPGAPMPGNHHADYVTVPRHLLADRRALMVWLKSSLEYALTLPPKNGDLTGQRPNQAGTRKRAGRKTNAKKATKATKKKATKATKKKATKAAKKKATKAAKKKATKAAKKKNSRIKTKL